MLVYDLIAVTFDVTIHKGSSNHFQINENIMLIDDNEIFMTIFNRDK